MQRQRGVALVVSLILLLVVTVAALSAVRYSSLELLIARNDEYRLNSYHAAQSLIDATLDAGVPATATDGIVACTASNAATGCNAANVQTLALPTSILPSSELDRSSASNFQTVVVRQIGHGLPVPRRYSGTGQHLESSRWVISATYEHNAAGAGSSVVHQGFYQEYGSNKDDSLYGN